MFYICYFFSWNQDLVPWRCNWCLLTFEDNESLKKHKNEVHVREKTCRCEICDQMFSSNEQLRKHHKNNHSLDDENKVNIILFSLMCPKKTIFTKYVKKFCWFFYFFLACMWRMWFYRKKRWAFKRSSLQYAYREKIQVWSGKMYLVIFNFSKIAGAYSRYFNLQFFKLYVNLLIFDEIFTFFKNI